MRSFPHVAFKVKWMPFFLNPMIPEGGVPLEDYLRKQYGDRDFSASAMHLRQAGAKVGINFLPSSERMVYPTMRGHRLVEFVKRKDDENCSKQNQIIEALFSLYFEQGADISSVDILERAASGAGVDTTGLREYLASNEDADLIAKQDNAVKKQRIHGVPHFTINKGGQKRKVSLSGGQPPEAFIEAFEEVGIVKRN